MIKAILTDIEGTTTSIRFVHDVLFPYAAEHMQAYVMANQQVSEVAEQLRATADEAGLDPADTATICDQLLAWIREDKKATPLKVLQGMIWKNGYAQGDFTGHVYQDAFDCLQAWRSNGLRLYVYSSGSVAAQKLIFGYSDFGDMTPLFSGYFDTRIGAKREVESYQAIIAELQLAADDILFLSDVPAELDAAAEAGMKVCQLVRDDSIERQDHHPVASNFHEVLIDL